MNNKDFKMFEYVYLDYFKTFVVNSLDMSLIPIGSPKTIGIYGYHFPLPTEYYINIYIYIVTLPYFVRQ